MKNTSKSEQVPDLSGKSIDELFRNLDHYTRAHSRRISRMAVIIARHMGIRDTDELRRLKLGILYHDIGKILISSKILDKPEPLSEKEYEIVKKHPEFSIPHIFPELDDISKIILHHHEFWDGTGYPRGLKGKEICLGARICCLVDSFDAMRTGRIYSKKMSFPAALKQINRCSGGRYDPAVVEAFNKCARKLDSIVKDR